MVEEYFSSLAFFPRELPRVLLQKIWKEVMGVKVSFSRRLLCREKQAGDTCNLTDDVAFFDTTYLPFPYHMHDLIALEGSPSGFR